MMTSDGGASSLRGSLASKSTIPGKLLLRRLLPLESPQIWLKRCTYVTNTISKTRIGQNLRNIFSGQKILSVRRRHLLGTRSANLIYQSRHVDSQVKQVEFADYELFLPWNVFSAICAVYVVWWSYSEILPTLSTCFLFFSGLAWQIGEIQVSFF